MRVQTVQAAGFRDIRPHVGLPIEVLHARTFKMAHLLCHANRRVREFLRRRAAPLQHLGV